MAPVHFDRRMTDAEGLMWRLEKDPYLSSTFSNLTILDRPIDIDRFRRRMEIAAMVVPRLHQRVQSMPANLAPPVWVDDPSFDIDYHVRHVALPKPGTMRQLADVAMLIAADPFDRTRPLWEFVVIDGLRGGKGALVQKMHHTVADGEGSIRLSMQFLDLERDAPGPEPVDAPSGTAPVGPSGLETIRDFMAGGMRLPIAMLGQVKELLAEPANIPRAGVAVVETIRGIASQLSDTEQARSPLWRERSLRRHLEMIRVPMERTRDAAKALGGTLNTAFVTAAAAAAGAYHRELGAPVDHLRASMAISTRTSSSGSNAFSIARLLVPTSDMPFADRFQIIASATTGARATSATASLETLAKVASTLPTSLVSRLARQQSQTVDFATSNVRAANFPCFIGGALVLQNHPIGPLAGVAFNLTMMSYCGSLDLGLNTDAASIEEPALLASLLTKAFDELHATAG